MPYFAWKQRFTRTYMKQINGEHVFTATCRKCGGVVTGKGRREIDAMEERNRAEDAHRNGGCE